MNFTITNFILIKCLHKYVQEKKVMFFMLINQCVMPNTLKIYSNDEILYTDDDAEKLYQDKLM